MIEIPTDEKKVEKFDSEALARLLQKIQEEADSELKRIQRNTKAKLENIENETQKLVEEIKKREVAKETSRIDFLKKRTETEYQQEARKIIIQTKEMLIDEVFDQVEIEFGSFRKNKEYSNYLERTLIRSIKNMRVKEVKILIDKKDEPIITKIMEGLSKKEGIKCTLNKTSLETSGGFILMDSRERVKIDHTLENLLEASKERIRTKINELLFV